MSERDDYLLDPSLPPDPDVAALERALAPLRGREVPLRDVPPRAPAPSRRRRTWLAAAAAVLAIGLLGWWWMRPDDALRPDSAPRTFATRDDARTIRLGDLAEITLRPGSELAFLHWRADQEARFALIRGGLAAHVAPEPKVAKGFFVVDTKHGAVVDQGCQYTLDLAADGSATVRVMDGAVTFAFPEHTVFVPAGASTVVDARGPSTPCFDDAAPELQKAVQGYDALRAKQADYELRAESVKRVLAAAQSARDSLVVWHLLRDPLEDLRKAALDHLVRIAGAPPGRKDVPDDPEEWLPYLRFQWRPQ
jgi:hypothetical protein